MGCRTFFRAALPALLLGLFAFAPADAAARSAASAPHSGLEAPGTPRRLQDVPTGSATAQSGGVSGMKGRLDAYGRPIVPTEPKQKIERKRLPAGAYGGYGQDDDVPPLPDVTPQSPAWKF